MALTRERVGKESPLEVSRDGGVHYVQNCLKSNAIRGAGCGRQSPSRRRSRSGSMSSCKRRALTRSDQLLLPDSPAGRDLRLPGLHRRPVGHAVAPAISADPALVGRSGHRHQRDRAPRRRDLHPDPLAPVAAVRSRRRRDCLPDAAGAEGWTRLLLGAHRHAGRDDDHRACHSASDLGCHRNPHCRHCRQSAGAMAAGARHSRRPPGRRPLEPVAERHRDPPPHQRPPRRGRHRRPALRGLGRPLGFREQITGWQPGRHIGWRFKFDDLAGWQMTDTHLMPNSSYFQVAMRRPLNALGNFAAAGERLEERSRSPAAFQPPVATKPRLRKARLP